MLMMLRSKWALAALLLLAVIATTTRAAAHGARTATLVVEITSDTEARLTLDAPLTVEAPDCSIDPPPAPIRMVHCSRGIAGQSLAVQGLGRMVDVVIVRMASSNGEQEGSTLTARAPVLILPGDAPHGGTVVRFIRLGCEHVLSGFDHLLFLLALFWQAYGASRQPEGAVDLRIRRRRVRQPEGAVDLRKVGFELAQTATAFTVAHSLTLTTTVLGWMRFPSNVAEACIALSLVLVAMDLGSREHVPRRSHRLALAFVFGLVHGLGFAGALASTRLPEHAMALGLLSFNAGVEIGQALVFGVCVALALFARRLRSTERKLDAIAATASAYAIGSAGVWLLLLRVTALLRG